MKVFLDTNVLVSAFASRGLCADVLELVLLDHDMVVGTNVLRELDKALREKVRLPAVRCAEVIDFIANEAVRIIDNAASANVDSADALVLGEALAAEAQLFVTGDDALLRLAVVDALDIASPRRFWEILRTTPNP